MSSVKLRAIASGTYGLGVGGEDALHQLEDEVGVSGDLVVSERDPLVDKRSLLEVGAKEGRVGGESSDWRMNWLAYRIKNEQGSRAGQIERVLST